MQTQVNYVGIDGCKGGWCVFQRQGKALRFQLTADLANLSAHLPENSVVFIDMPIGFAKPGEAQRQCDKLTRQALPGRRGSVFPVPCKAAAYAPDYRTACEVNAELMGKRFPIQTWYILPKMRELHELLLQLRHQGSAIRFYESHPELVFSGFAGQPMAELKSTEAGQQARLALLAALAPQAMPVLEHALQHTAKKVAKADDIIDAFALMLAASQPDNWQFLPSKADYDSDGLSRQIVFAARSTQRLSTVK